MMDHYKVLGISRNASKEEIKESFRKFALKFHPDRHSQSSKAVKDGATLQFKNISEAYEVLIDDRKRADYNMRFSRRGGPSASSSSSSSSSYRDYYYHNISKPRPTYSSSSRRGFNFDVALRFLNTRAFLLNLAFTCVVLGGAIFVERSADALWKTQNSGKSFEEAMESIDKLKTQKEKR